MARRATPPMTDPAITAGLAPLLSLAGTCGGRLVCAGGREVFELADNAVDDDDGGMMVVVAEELAGRVLLLLLTTCLLAGGSSM